MNANDNLPPGASGKEPTFQDTKLVEYECCGLTWESYYWPFGEQCAECGKTVYAKD